MKCIVCGADMQADEQGCTNCMKIENKFQVLTLEDRQEFSGVTLEQGQEQEAGAYYEYKNHNGNQRIYSKQFSIMNMGFVTKILLGIIFLGTLFVALPLAILVISIVSFILYFLRK